MKLIETHKNCSKCGEPDLITNYHWRKKGESRHDVCASCRNSVRSHDRHENRKNKEMAQNAETSKMISMAWR